MGQERRCCCSRRITLVLGMSRKQHTARKQGAGFPGVRTRRRPPGPARARSASAQTLPHPRSMHHDPALQTMHALVGFDCHRESDCSLQQERTGRSACRDSAGLHVPLPAPAADAASVWARAGAPGAGAAPGGWWARRAAAASARRRARARAPRACASRRSCPLCTWPSFSARSCARPAPSGRPPGIAHGALQHAGPWRQSQLGAIRVRAPQPVQQLGRCRLKRRWIQLLQPLVDFLGGQRPSA
jgi:hypothetical protein